MTKAAALFALTDLDAFGDEPRVKDLIVAERLGYDDPHKIRQLIERNRAELETYGAISATAAENTGRGRPGHEHHLNEGQALVICALSRTPKAAEVRKALIDVFMAWRRGARTAPDLTALKAETASLNAACRVIGETRRALGSRAAARIAPEMLRRLGIRIDEEAARPDQGELPLPGNA